AENVAEDVLSESLGSGAAAAELEMRAARPLLAPEAGEGIAAGRALETLEARLAVRADLATVEGGALLLVADDLIGLICGREMVLGLRIVRVLVRMILLGQLPIG